MDHELMKKPSELGDTKKARVLTTEILGSFEQKRLDEAHASTDPRAQTVLLAAAYTASRLSEWLNGYREEL